MAAHLPGTAPVAVTSDGCRGRTAGGVMGAAGRSRGGRGRPSGVVTRGTTAPNRLRRVDRWLATRHATALRAADDPLVVDLGFGASPVTTVELFQRLREVCPRVQVTGVEIDPGRVTEAARHAGPGLDFRVGGFEVPLADPRRRPVVVRAFNVLRQYDEEQVAAAWASVCSRLAPGGVLVEGTCDELGRLASWVELGCDGRPRTLTLAARLSALARPSRWAERLPKALIHRNVPGEPVHAFLSALDRAWDVQAPLAAYGARHRWVRTVALVAREWPVTDRPARWRQGEVTVAWKAVAPRPGLGG